VLAQLTRLEREFGRRRGRRWGTRVLDLDIIAWSGGKWHARGLQVPHRSATQRSFVMGPLATIAPGWQLSGHLTAHHFAHRLAQRRPQG
jgi:2-amino-4-hydroxy-6-hydroxymethyldihydropteridine diphosphokinase